MDHPPSVPSDVWSSLVAWINATLPGRVIEFEEVALPVDAVARVHPKWSSLVDAFVLVRTKNHSTTVELVFVGGQVGYSHKFPSKVNTPTAGKEA